jgi:hypothetical protein
MKKVQVEELTKILATMQETDFASVQSMDLLREYGFSLKGWMAFSAEQQAIAKENLHLARRQAMINLAGSLKANGVALSATLQKEWVNDSCSKENYAYELAERTNKACSAAIGLVITCLSGLKEELKMESFTNNNGV